MAVYGYHRTSTRDQHLDRGIHEIQAFCREHDLELENIFTDQQAGKNFNRPRYMVLVEDVLREGDSGTFQQFHFIQRFLTAGFLMRTQEVIVSAPERNAVYCSAVRTITAGDPVRFLECTVQAFDPLFEWSEFFGYFVVIGKADHLRDEYVPAFFKLELLGGKRVRAVTISNEFQSSAREFLKFIKCHAHGKNAGADIS